MELHPYLEPGCVPVARFWHVLAAGGERPVLRVGHTAVHVNSSNDHHSNGKLYIVGGANPSGTFAETFALDLDTFSWHKLDIPSLVGRYEHTAFVVPAEPTNVYVFGGANATGNLNDVQVFDTTTNEGRSSSWQVIDASGTPPSPRTFHNGTCIRNQFIVYGGGECGAQPVADRNTYVFDVVCRRWSTLKLRGDPPKPRHGHIMVSVGGGRLFLHGGMSGSAFFDDVHILDIDRSQWSHAKVKSMKPPGRAAHAGFVVGSSLFIFGGMNHNGALDDMHQLNMNTMEWCLVKLNGPPPECRLDFASCVVRLKIGSSFARCALDDGKDHAGSCANVNQKDRAQDRNGDAEASRTHIAPALSPLVAIAADPDSAVASLGQDTTVAAACGDMPTEMNVVDITSQLTGQLVSGSDEIQSSISEMPSAAVMASFTECGTSQLPDPCPASISTTAADLEHLSIGDGKDAAAVTVAVTDPVGACPYGGSSVAKEVHNCDSVIVVMGFVLGGMDTGGEVFDDCLVVRFDENAATGEAVGRQ